MSEINECGVEPPVELALPPAPPSLYLELMTKNRRGVLGRGECGKSWGLGALGRRWPPECCCGSLKVASGLPRVVGCFWRLWAGGGGGTGALVWERSNAEASPPLRQTDGQGGVVVLENWRGPAGKLRPRKGKEPCRNSVAGPQ